MDPFGISNNSITSAKALFEANKALAEEKRALDKKNEKDEKYKRELLDTAKVLNEIKRVADQQKESAEKFNNSSDKMSKRMYWLTIAITGLTFIMTVVAIIQLAKMI